jgi:hypothetical protein
MVVRTVTTIIVLTAVLAIGLLLAVGIGDPLLNTVTAYDLGGMDTQAIAIHATIVKWMPPAGFGGLLLWGVFRLLRTERQRGGF